MTDFLPINRKEMKQRGWTQPDFVYVSGDAYVDHSSFGAAIITRLLEAHGYKVAMLCQPDWKEDVSVQEFGEPRLGFIVSAGNMDSMVNHYSVARKHRHTDAYSPGGKAGMRPDRAVTVYSNLIRRSYKKTPIILGGIEASLRRLAHYDYWSDKMRHSVLIDSGADLISYGMGEHSIIEIADALNSGLAVQDLTFIRGTVYKSRTLDHIPEYILLPSYEEVTADKRKYAESFNIQHENTDAITASVLVEDYGNRGYVIANPPAYPLTQQEMDDVYDLPYMRAWHPSYDKEGGIPAFSEIKYSITNNRGCYGGCNFCALTFHQGRTVQVRSHASMLKEARQFTTEKDFKGNIHDVGGPTADFRAPSCQKQLTKGVCPHRQCLFPTPCKNLRVDHSDYLHLLREMKAIPGVKKIFVRSGIRFDYLMADADRSFFKELVSEHVSGQLRVAPEHVSDTVLSCMGKPRHAVYQGFLKEFDRITRSCHKEQYAIPYFMSSHPGCGLKEAVELAEYIRDLGYMPEQVQDFYPTPSTISTCMYYTGLDPRTMEPVYVPRSAHEKAMQRALIQYRLPENYELVKEALLKTGRQDLIGFGKDCLIPPRKISGKRSHKPSAGGHITDRSQTKQEKHEVSRPQGKTQLPKYSRDTQKRRTNAQKNNRGATVRRTKADRYSMAHNEKKGRTR